MWGGASDDSSIYFCDPSEFSDYRWMTLDEQTGGMPWERRLVGNCPELQSAVQNPKPEPPNDEAEPEEEIVVQENDQNQPAAIAVQARARSGSREREVIDVAATLATTPTNEIVLEAARIAWDGKLPRGRARFYGLFFKTMTNGVARAHDSRTGRRMKATIDANPSFRALVQGPHPRFNEVVDMFRSDRDVMLGVPGATLYYTSEPLQVDVVRAPLPKTKKQ
jgi:hypothetical protein